MKTTSITAVVFFFEVSFRNYLTTAMFKVLLQQLQGPLTTAFETIHYSWRYYGHESPHELMFSWVNIFKQKSTKVPGKLSFTQ